MCLPTVSYLNLCCVPAHCELLEHVVLLTSVSGQITSSTLRLMVNDELESIRCEAAITYSKRSSAICLDGLIKTTEDRSQDGL